MSFLLLLLFIFEMQSLVADAQIVKRLRAVCLPPRASVADPAENNQVKYHWESIPNRLSYKGCSSEAISRIFSNISPRPQRGR